MLAMFDGYRVPPHVMGDSIDGETIVIDALTGIYYTLDADVTAVWSKVADPSPAIPNADILDVLAALVDEGLLVGPAGTARTTTRPCFVKYTDMEELLLADPIHEVDDRGWPLLRQ
jgi:hypothetical protein